MLERVLLTTAGAEIGWVAIARGMASGWVTGAAIFGDEGWWLGIDACGMGVQEIAHVAMREMSQRVDAVCMG